MTSAVELFKSFFRPEYPDSGVRGNYEQLLEDVDVNALRDAETYYISLGLMTEDQRLELPEADTGSRPSS